MSCSGEEEVYPEVDELKEELLQALLKVDSDASFSCKGTIARPPNPGIEVEDLGIIGLPVSTRDAELLISKCRQSPFGKGEETVIDDSVRKSWELSPSQFSLSNPDWLSCMATVVDAVHRDLGLTCHRIGVHAELYKLLIYEEGAFFKPHQDSEKTPGMFGTLVVCLPSKHEGGKVLLTHDKRKKEFATANSSRFDITFAAWYSDVLHEVEKVTSGYRIVLTYNLVQNSSLSQKAPDPDTKVRVVRALKLWEKASADNEPDFPPYIIHQLEHYYSRNGANISMLKGHDAAQVRCLESACQELDWGVYLAVYEKTVRRDDECGDEEFDRDEEFEYLTELDGTDVDLCPEYDKSFRLDDYNSDDEDADESEHEGYTGNEGAPATFWYRQTVVLLVPPSRKLEFGWTSSKKYTFAPNMLRSLRLKSLEQSTSKKQLYRVCHILLPEFSGGDSWPKRSYGHSWSTSSATSSISSPEAKQCLAQVCEITLEHEWVDLFDRVPMEQKTTLECLDALGTFLFYHGADSIKAEITTMIKNAANLAEKYKLLKMITQAFNKNPTELPDAADHKAEFDSWYKIAFKDILDTQQRANKDDGATLGEIARECHTDVHDRILSKLDSASTQTITAFVLTFTKENPNLELLAYTAYLGKVLEKLWNDFRYAQAVRTHGATVDALNQHELAEIMNLTKKCSQVPMSHVFSAMSDALADVDEKYISDQLCPFVKSIMSHKISSLIIENDSDLFDTVADYIQLVLCAYIRRLVGNEPKEPRNWSLPHRGCLNLCVWCPKVNTFMADKKEKVLRYQMIGEGRKHLDRQFGSWHIKDPQFDTTVDTCVRPYTWVCTKDHKAFKRDHPAWKSHRQEAQHRLKSIGGRNMVHLKKYLGENFDAIMSCRTEDLPNLGSKELTDKEPLSFVDASSLNARNNKKRKLNVSDQIGPDDSSVSKRARPADSVPDPADVIDLT